MFRQALARTSPGEGTVLALSTPETRNYLSALERQRRISALTGIASQAISQRPGDLPAVLAGLRAAAPQEATIVGSRLTASFPGYAPHITSGLGIASSSIIAAPAAVQAAAWPASAPVAAPSASPSRASGHAAPVSYTHLTLPTIYSV